MTAGSLGSGTVLVKQRTYTPWTLPTLTFGFYLDFNSLPASYKGPPVGTLPYPPASGPTPAYDAPNLVESLTADERGWVSTYLDPALGSERYIGNFIDVDFSPIAVAANANLAFGALAGFTTPAADAWASFGATGAQGVKGGDVWLTDNARIGAAGRPVDWFYHAVFHELGHALGLSHTFVGDVITNPLPGLNAVENTQKYSVMAYRRHSAENRDVIELQLYDIVALQRNYGRNDQYKAGADVYTLFTDTLPGSSTQVDRVFSIWDGGGRDEISARAYTGKSAYIDLRPGHFSSIGINAFQNNTLFSAGSIKNDWTVTLSSSGGLGRENVSIAFGTYIEDATGAENANDVLIGNMLSNRLLGLSGNDMLFADGFAIDHANEIFEGELERAPTGINANLPDGGWFGFASPDTDADYERVGKIPGAETEPPPFDPDRGTQNDRLEGGDGNDLIAGGWGRDILIGDKGNDVLIGDKGNDTLIGGEDDDILLGESDNDWLDGDRGTDDLRGGRGDDKLIAEVNDGNDKLDGESGTDTVVYQWEQGNGLIRVLKDQGSSDRQRPIDFGLAITGAKDNQGNVGSFGEDTLTSIEKAAVQAGGGTDVLSLSDESELGYIDYVDFGGQASNQFDTINMRAVTTDAFVDLSLDRLEIDKPWSWPLSFLSSKETLDVRNAEGVAGGTGNDVLLGGILTGVIPAYASAGALVPSRNDRLAVGGENGRKSLAGGKYVLDGGEGNDTVVLSAGEGSDVIGGLGRDFLINRSKDGVIVGDTVDGTYRKVRTDLLGNPVLDDNGQPIVDIKQVEDTEDNGDLIWWWQDTTLLDPGKYDQLRFFGMPLTGGNNIPAMALGGMFLGALGLAEGGLGYRLFQNAVDPKTGQWDVTRNLYFDHFMPFMTYYLQRQPDGTVDLYIFNQLTGLDGADLFSKTGDDPNTPEREGVSLAGAMRIKNYQGHYSFSGSAQSKILGKSDLGIGFKVANPFQSILAMLPPMLMTYTQGQGGALVDEAMTLRAASERWAKALKWSNPGDPLVLDLDGDGIETVELGSFAPYFDVDGDMFAERTGWLGADDGFLVLDANQNGRIDDISEMFGNAAQTGFAELATHDSNKDGRITQADQSWSKLLVWQDRDSDGITDAGELSTLDQLGLRSIGLTPTALGVTTPQGTDLLSYATFTRADGTSGQVFEAIFQSNDVDTRYAGEAGRAAWQSDLRLNAKGFGTVTDLAVAMANDIELGELAAATAAAMTAPKLKTLIQQAGPVLGKWGAGLELTRELVAVKLGKDADGKTVLLDRAVYVEDHQGGFWTLNSKTEILDTQGTRIARPTLEQVLAQGADWRLEQAWSPSSRASAVKYREEVPYLVEIVAGRAVVQDHGIKNANGSWSLASAPAVSYATRGELLALARPANTEWRIEEIGFNTYAAIPVEAIGVRFTDGRVVDYTVEVTDDDGTFYVWARNLDRALELEAKTGDSREFVLRNYAVDFDKLDEVGSSDDSAYRVELLTPAQFHFAVSLGGIDFRPEMLSAKLDMETGHIAYSVNQTGRASLSQDSYVSAIKPMIEMVGVAMEQYVIASRRFAVRMAMQGGLKEFARGITYDPAADKYKPTTDRELAPLFEAIFEKMPTTNQGDAAVDYLTSWNEILWQIYPDYALKGKGNLLGGTVTIDQAFIFQMLLPAFEKGGIPLDIFEVANALSIDEKRLRLHSGTDTYVEGTEGVDFFYMTAGNQLLRGKAGSDYYFVGKNSGQDSIEDIDLGDNDELRFTDVKSSQVKATREGQNLLLKVTAEGRTETILLVNQFLGELNEYTRSGKQFESGVNSIVFSDGVIWDRFRMSMEVVDKERAAGAHRDDLIGSGSADILWGGKDNDLMSGGAGGDIYIFERGDGQDVIDDRGAFSFGPVKAGLDFLRFRGDISANDLKLTRDGNSSDLLITLLDKNGNPTTDTIKMVGQLGGISLGLGLFSEVLGGSDGLDYVSPTLIERFIFDDGTSLEFTEIVERVLRNAKTDGDDIIYGLLNANTLDGGKGKDALTGLQGSDTYIFGRGYGEDVIYDNDLSFKAFAGPQHDTLKLIDGLGWGDFDFLRDGAGDTLSMRIKGTQDKVILRDFLEEIPFIGQINLLEHIAFGDGTTWSSGKLLQHYVAIAKTAGDDIIYGFEGFRDEMDGGAGNDHLEGQSGSDTYIFGRGYGTDTVLDSSGEERVLMQGIAWDDIENPTRTALDLIFTVRGTGERIVIKNQYVREGTQAYAVEYFEFADRTVHFTEVNAEDIHLGSTNSGETITGSNFAELLDGKGGNDTLIGGDGGDTYRFDVGYGHDVIFDRRVRARWNDRAGVVVPTEDTIEFGDDIRYKTNKNVKFTRSGDDLVVSVIDRPGHTLTIKNQFGPDVEDGVERFIFKDGTELDISDIEEEFVIEGGNYADNVITGSLDNPNSLDGRQGDDTLKGGHAADLYAFTTEYDFDKIIEQRDRAGVIDKLVFGASVDKNSLIVRRSGEDLLIDLGNGTDVVTIVGGLADTRVEAFSFRDGTEWTLEQVLDRLLTGGAADEHLTGFDHRNDTLSGGAGSDGMAGGKGNDTYLFGLGDGSDSVTDSGGIDTIRFGAAITKDMLAFRNVDGDLLITLASGEDKLVILGGYNQNPVETFAFADGSSLGIADVRALIAAQQSNEGQDKFDLKDFDEAPVVPGAGHDATILDNDSTITFQPGDGIDRVEMAPGATRATIEFSELGSTDVVVRLAALDSSDLILSFPATGDQLVLVGAAGGGAVPLLVFADGQRWDAATLIQHSIADQSGSGDDIVLGSTRADTIEGSGGNDQLRGGAGDDVYLFGLGDGRDVIDDSAGADTLKVSGYRADEMRVARTAPGRSELVLSFGEGDDEVVLRYDGSFNGIDAIEFGDGTRFTRDQLFDRVNTEGSVGDDRLTGTARDEVFTGGRGNDVLIGAGGSDTFVFNRGDGQDRIESNGSTDGRGVLQFGSGIALEGVVAKRDAAGNLVLTIRNSSDSVTLVDPPADADPVVAQVRFADNRTRSYAALALSVLETDGDDHIIVPSSATNAGGGSGVEVFGGLGNDRIESGRGNDIVTGGKGNDRLEGKSGADTYYFERGDGQDVIADLEENDAAKIDRIRFGPGILATDIRFLSVGPRDLVIGIAGTSDRITIADMFTAAGGPADHGIEEIAFADGTVWDLAEIHARAGTGAAGADSIDFGTTLDLPVTLQGGKGDDRLAGGHGDNSYLFARGDGRDTISEGSNWWWSDDRLRLGSGIGQADVVVTREGNDLLLRIVGGDDRIVILGQATASQPPIDRVVFDDGSEWSAATLAAKVVGEDAAQRLLHPSATGADPFSAPIFSTGSGQSGGGTGGSDGGIEAGAGSQTLTGTAGRDTYKLFVPLSAASESVVTVTDFAAGDSGDILDIRVAAGLSGTVVTRQEGADTHVYFAQAGTASLEEARLLLRLQGVTASALTAANLNGAPFELANATLAGNGSANTLTGGWGNDSISGHAGNDVIDGRAGNDSIDAGTGSDRITGGRGDDSIDGGEDTDTFIYNPGDGNDFITDYGTGGAVDVLEFGAGITRSMLIFSASPSDSHDIVIRFKDLDGSLTLNEKLATYHHGPNLIRFADGSTMSDSEIIHAALAGQDSAGDDRLHGSYLGGSVEGGAGNDTITGSHGDDAITGGTGDDLLHGDGGNDTFWFARGDGQDTIYEYDDWRADGYGGFDTVQFAAGINPADVTVRQRGAADLILEIAGTSDRVVLGATVSDGDNRIEQVRFANGTVWSHADLVARALAAASTTGDDIIYGSHESDTNNGGAGNDTLTGSHGNDIVIGGIGNDLLHGDGGNDVFRFARGDGQDTIYEYNANWRGDGYGGYDAIEFAAGILPGDVIVRQQGASDLVLQIAGSEDRITIGGTITDGDHRVEEVRFANGIVWSHAELVTRALAAASTTGDDTIYGSHASDAIAGGIGNDTLIASHGDDVVTGGTGNDLMHGGGGNDVFRFARGDGRDTIYEYSSNWRGEGYGGFDAIEFASGINPADVTVRQQGSSDLVLHIAGSEDRITIGGTITDGDNRVEEVRFANGTKWSHADLMTLAAGGTLAAASQQAASVTVLSGPEVSGGEAETGGSAAAAPAAPAGDASPVAAAAASSVPSSGDDDIQGGAGDETIEGGIGSDVVRGGGGNDRLFGGNEGVVVDDAAADVAAYFGALSSTLVNGLGGPAGFGEAALPAADDGEFEVAVPASFGADGLAIDGGTASTILIDNNGAVLIGGVTLKLFSGDVDTETGAMTPSPGGNSAGSNKIWYDFDEATRTVTVTWDDVGRWNNGTEPNAFQLQLVDKGNGDFDVIYRYEAQSWNGNGGGAIISTSAGTHTILRPGVDRIGNLGAAGVWAFQVRGGEIVGAPTRGDGHDELLGESGDDLLQGGSGSDLLNGGEGGDTVLGGSGEDFLEGIGDDLEVDTLTGGAGVDTFAIGLLGGEQPDGIIPSDPVPAIDIITDFQTGPDGDILDLWAFTTGDYDPLIDGEFVLRQDGADTLVVRDLDSAGGEGRTHVVARILATQVGDFTAENLRGISIPSYEAQTIDGGADHDVFDGSPVADTIRGNDGNDDLYGYGGADTLIGGAGTDYIEGGAGADHIEGNADNDTLYGDTGNDTILAGDGDDKVYGWRGDDVIEGGLGDDEIIGAYGKDRIGGGDGADRIWGGDDDDTIDGGIGNDELVGNFGADAITGGDGNDNIWGAEGADRIDAGAGLDNVYGNEEDDVIEGGLGGDNLYGGAGNDRLIGGNDGVVVDDSAADLSSYFGPVTNALINTLGGTAGFGENSLPRSYSGAVNVAIPTDFAPGGAQVGDQTITSLTIGSDSSVRLGGATIYPLWSSSFDTSTGALTVSPGGNSTGANLVWYDFDAATRTVTITWDDVGEYYHRTVPNAYQLQIRLKDGGDFDVLMRFENVEWAWNGPYITTGTSSYFQEAPGGDRRSFDTAVGNLGAVGVWGFQISGGEIIGVPTDGDGRDDLYGEEGDDVLIGGSGRDYLVGG